MNPVVMNAIGRMRRDRLMFCRVMLAKKPHPGQVTWLRNSILADQYPRSG